MAASLFVCTSVIRAAIKAQIPNIQRTGSSLLTLALTCCVQALQEYVYSRLSQGWGCVAVTVLRGEID